MTPLIWALTALLPAATELPNRTIARFDFEEAQERPMDMPLAFEQVGEMNPDFPRFGGMSLVSEDRHSGQFAFQFDLKGRSMAARTVSGTLPILPRVDHRISTMVQTKGLNRAGVRLVAWLLDEHGQELPGSRVMSSLLSESPATHARWRELALLVPNSEPDATELMLELQLVQPQLQTGRAQEDTRPLLEDITGTAIFDDIQIEQWPRLYLADSSRIGLHVDAEPVLHLRIDDPAPVPTIWQIEISNSSGEVVHAADGVVPPNGLDETLVLPLADKDWYQVRAVTRESNRILAEDELTLAITDGVRWHEPEARICIDLSQHMLDETSSSSLAVDLLGHLGAGEAIVPVWNSQMNFDESWPSTLHQVDEMKRLQIEPVLALNWLPPEYRELGPFDDGDAASLITKHPETLDNLVESSIIAWGDTGSRWRIGRAEDSPTHLEGAAEALKERLEGLVFNLDISTPGTSSASAQLPMTPREEVATASASVLEAWCHDEQIIELPAPWKAGSHGLQPTPFYPALKHLIQAVGGRSEVTWLPVQPSLHACMLEGNDQEPVIVVWKKDPNGPHEELSLPITSEQVRCLDVLGQPAARRPEQHQHHILIEDLPVIIKGFSASGPRLMSGLLLQPQSLPAELKVHDHRLSLRNNSSRPLVGHLIANAVEGVELRPAIIGLDLAPGETLEIPLEVVVTTPLPAGAVPIHWEARLERGHRLPMTTWMTVGLPDLQVDWTRRNTSSRDLVIDLDLINEGQEPRVVHVSLGHVDLDMGPAARLTVAPGASLSQTFRIPDGEYSLAGASISLMLEDRETNGKLREMMPIAPRPITAGVSDQTTP
ncbi:MAG: hypothetical protein MK089_00670 [Phycisphaerales bacterium]|nr:hypothetical protein [Phycisphaerales bacterium]